MLLNQMLVDERNKAEADKNDLQNKLLKANEELAALKSRIGMQQCRTDIEATGTIPTPNF